MGSHMFTDRGMDLKFMGSLLLWDFKHFWGGFGVRRQQRLDGAPRPYNEAKDTLACIFLFFTELTLLKAG